MGIVIEGRHLDGAAVLRPDVFPDSRGFFSVVNQTSVFSGLGMPVRFVQQNFSRSARGVVRGLHFQWDPPMAKLMRVSYGRAFLVAVDIRKGSPTLGKWFGTEVSSDDCRMLYAPAGFARGLCALTDEVMLDYQCTAEYNPQGESGILWNDPEIGIKWPVDKPILSDKDRDAKSFRDWLARPESNSFTYDNKH
jgi:dTDP-4-dehydrorhamnose 3,5-epimerase